MGRRDFTEDEWDRPEGGGGGRPVCSMEGGRVFEQAGINFSHVYGRSACRASATAQRPELAGRRFEALGVSIVHPGNPYVPTTHCNVRFFSASARHEPVWWFGGGFDLTPYYGFDEDAVHWHGQRAGLRTVRRGRLRSVQEVV